MALERFANAPIPSSPSTAWTTLSASIDASTPTIPVVGFAAFPSTVQFRILIGDEYLLVTAGAGTTSWTATRGIEGSTAAVHASGASVFHVLTAAGLANHPRSMTTGGDLEYLSAAFAPTRLGIGSAGQFLRVSAGLPAWSSLLAGDIPDISASYLTPAAAAAAYQPLGSYAAASHTHTASQITDLATASVAFSNKTGAISQWTNDSGYLTSASADALFTTPAEVTTALGAYLPLAGGTLTGPLTGTSGIVEQRDGATAQVLRGYYSYTDASNYLRWSITPSASAITIAVETLGTGADNVDMEFTTAGSGKVHFTVGGNVLDYLSSGLLSGPQLFKGGGFEAAAANYIYWAARTSMKSPSDGNLFISNNAETDFGRMMFGGSTSSFPALARDSAGLKVIGADGTTGVFLSGVEQTAPVAPAANGYRIFAEDNGGAKTRLMVIFASGAAQQLAVEP